MAAQWVLGGHRWVVECAGRVFMHADAFHHCGRPKVADGGERHDLVEAEPFETDLQHAARSLARKPLAPPLSAEAPADLHAG